MHVIVDFTVVPVGAGVSLSRHIAEVERVLHGTGLNYELHANLFFWATEGRLRC